MVSLEERIEGGIWGLVIGDALGVPVEFRDRQWLKQHPVQEMVGYGTHKQPSGTWSDDSSLTLCHVVSLTEKGFDLEDTMLRFRRWHENGYLTPFGNAFDIGNTTYKALRRFVQGCAPDQCGLDDERSNGNGSLMRILPVAIWFYGHDTGPALANIARASALTHRHPRSILGCQLYTLMVWELLKGYSPHTAYQNVCLSWKERMKDQASVAEIAHYERVIGGELVYLGEDDVVSDGYVVSTLEAALWCLLKESDFKGTVLRAVNLGYDTDTTAAVAGGLAGICYGLKAIPENWQSSIIRGQEIRRIIEGFSKRITG